MFSCAIADDSVHALIGGHNGTWLIKLETGQPIQKFDEGCMHVGFVPNEDKTIGDIVIDSKCF